MIRGTTPTQIVNLPIDTSIVKKVRITYSQGSKTIVEKTEQDVAMSDKTIRFNLTQEETLSFSATTTVRVQIKVLTTANFVHACRIKCITVDDILNEEVLE